MNSGRTEFLKMLHARRAERIKETADKYAKLPANIRAAIAKVAGVENARLDQLSDKDRAELMRAAHGMMRQIDAAYALLLTAQVQGRE